MQRIHESLTGRAERIVLGWLCARLPGWVTPDRLTALGVFGAALSFIGYALASRGAGMLWLAIAGVAINWFGDSLDGSLARHRRIERPRYGFFLDHMTDTLAMGLIAIGIGLSPYACLISGMAVLLGYYAMVILAMVTTQATGIFRVSLHGVGPTEIRLFIIACTLAAIAVPTPAFMWAGWRLTVYDAIMLALTALLVGACAQQSCATARDLAAQDPGPIP